MNIKVNSTFTNYKTNNIQQNNHVLNTDNVNFEYTNSTHTNVLKSDIYSNSDINLQARNNSDLFTFVKKVLYSEKFREIAIDSNPVLKEAYDNFIKAITMDDSKLSEYIKSVLSDSSKFSGEFFDALNTILLETTDNSLKNSIYNFLKIFDYYSSQIENASAVNSALNDIIKSLPEDVRDALLKLLANSFSNKLSSFFLSALSTNLPDNEKLKLIFSFTLDLIKNENNDFLNIFGNKEQLVNEANDFADTLIKTLKGSTILIPNDIKKLLKSLEDTLKEIHNTNSSDKILTTEALIEKKSNIELIIKLIQNISTKENSLIEDNLNNVISFMNQLKNLASTDDIKALDNIADSLLLIKSSLLENSSQSTSDFFNVLDSIKNNILSNNSFSQDVKKQLVVLLKELTSNLLEKLINSNTSKNKCEMLLNIYEKNIMPTLLKNNYLLTKNTLSVITHNLLRLKLGTASEFSKQIEDLFNHFEYNKILDTEHALFMKLGLIKKLTSQQTANDGMTSFLKLLDSGINVNNNEINKLAFENTLMALISKNDINEALKYFFLPLLYNGKHVLSELFISKNNIEDEEKENLNNELLEDILKITMIFDIEDEGTFRTTLFYSKGVVSAKIITPKGFELSNSKVLDDIKNIMLKHNLNVKNIVVTN